MLPVNIISVSAPTCVIRFTIPIVKGKYASILIKINVKLNILLRIVSSSTGE